MTKIFSTATYLRGGGKKKPQIKVTNSAGTLLHTYEVENFDNCYICNQDSGEQTCNYIINGNLYLSNYKLDTPIDDTGLCTCCDTEAYSTYVGLYIKSGKIWCYDKTNWTTAISTASYNSDGRVWKKVSGKNRYDMNYPLLMCDTSKSTYNVYGWRSKDVSGNLASCSYFKNATDIAGLYYAKSGWNGFGAAITPDGFYIIQNGSYSTKLKWLGICSWSAIEDGTGGISCITTDDIWYVGPKPFGEVLKAITTSLKVKQVTPGVDGRTDTTKYVYAIGLEDSHLYMLTVTGKTVGTPTLIDDGTWQSIAPFVRNSGALGIKDGKVYKLVGSTITELPALGSNNTKVEGCGRFLVYT